MQETLRQLGELLLGSIPTVFLFLLAYVSYRYLLHAPLVRVLEERHALTVGAAERARADVAAAEAKTAEYEQRLREAKIAIFKAQEARRQQALQVRADAVQQARALASHRIGEARRAIESDISAAKSALLPESERLAGEVIRTILKPAHAAQPGGAQ